MYPACKKQIKEGLSDEDALQLVFDQIEEAKIQKLEAYFTSPQWRMTKAKNKRWQRTK